MAFIAVIRKSYGAAGRNSNQTYVNVVTDVREVAGPFSVVSAKAPWNDNTHPDFIVELTQGEHDALKRREDLFHDGQPNQPRWQQQNTGTGSVKSLGHWTDPADDTSGWNADTELGDSRWIVRIGDGDPATPANHLATLDLDEDQNSAGQSGGRYVLNLRLYNPNGTPASNVNAQNAKTEIAGKLMIFDFTSGLTDFGIDTTRPGSVRFPSNHRYRVVGPNGEKDFRAQIFGRDLTVED